VPDFGPSNEHELEIARMSRKDCEFLGRYLQWRVEHPIPK